MILSITQYVLLFFIYSFAGWVMEVTLLFFENKKFVNRGFLIGPYCPIYGCGAIFITIVLYRYENDRSYVIYNDNALMWLVRIYHKLGNGKSI